MVASLGPAGRGYVKTGLRVLNKTLVNQLLSTHQNATHQISKACTRFLRLGGPLVQGSVARKRCLWKLVCEISPPIPTSRSELNFEIVSTTLENEAIPTLENEAIPTLENEAIQSDWMSDHFGRLGSYSSTRG